MLRASQSDNLGSLLTQLQKYPQEELYRLIVDGMLHKAENGWVGYSEREPGCLKAAFNGLAFAITNLEQSTLTIEYLKEIHQICTTQVTNLPGFHQMQQQGANVSGVMRSHPINHVSGYSLNSNSSSIEGLAEILDEIEREEDYQEHHGVWLIKIDQVREGVCIPNFASGIRYHTFQTKKRACGANTNLEFAEQLFPMIQGQLLHYLAPRSGAVFDKKLKALIENYNQTILYANADEKLRIIIDLIYQLEHLHPFFDANTRTFTICLQNRLLMQNGYLPATHYNPNTYGHAYSKKQLLEEIKIGIKNTHDIIAGEKNSFAFNTSTIPKSYQEEYPAIISHFVNTLNEEACRLNTSDDKVEISEKSLQEIKEDLLTKMDGAQLKRRSLVLDDESMPVSNNTSAFFHGQQAPVDETEKEVSKLPKPRHNDRCLLS